MNLHTSWLLRYLDRPIGHRELVDAMPRAALEVEAEIPDGDGFQIELKVLPNRPDCLGILGISREMAALFDINTRWPDDAMPTPSGDERFDVRIEAPELCRRFTAAVFRGVKVGPSPAWLQQGLAQAGMRPINNIVDITNFVMWETGQPLHAFDLNRLTGPGIVVRRLRAGESLDLLSGKPIDSTLGQPLCVCDTERPQALAGIKGGRTAGTELTTTDVLLEAAYFDPVHVRNNVKALRRRDGDGGTDSSYRFERGVDPNAMLDRARRRAYTLIAEISGGRLAGPPTDVIAQPTAPRTFHLPAARVARLIGTPVDAAVVKTSLEKLGYRVDERETVTVPTFRVDVDDAVVLAEDVARMIGYDNIAAELRPARATRGQTCRTDRLRQGLTRAMVDTGWLETKNDPLESLAKAGRWVSEPPESIQLRNASTAEMAVLRRTLLCGLLASAQRNVFRGAAGVRLFEIDRTFATLPGSWTLAGICGGTPGPAAWRGATAIDFFTLKGAIEDVLDACGLGATFAKTTRVPGLAGATAALHVDSVEAGWVGELDPKQAKVDRAAFKLFAFEIDLGVLDKSFERTPTYMPVSRFPPSVRDLAVVAGTAVVFEQIDRVVRQAAGPTLAGVELVDEYRGPPVPAGHRSLAMRLTFRDADRTLTAESVTEAVDAVVKRLGTELGASLRT